jgi:hypothetical protein
VTTRAEIADWFDHAKQTGATHLIVVCDTFDHEDYPVYAMSDAECLEKFAHYHGPNMQRVMEIYDTRRNREAQLDERLSWHLPQETAKRV